MSRLIKENKALCELSLTCPVIKDYKKYLEITYGNYMELPPEKDRLAAIHAEYVDLNKSYEEYVK